MSRRRRVCGTVTVGGGPCRNGPGCTVNHQTVPGGPVVAMTAAAGPGPDPFAAGLTSAGAGAASLDDVLGQLTVEADGDPKYRGKLFEPVVIKWLDRVARATPLGTFTEPTRTDPDRSDPPPTIGDIGTVYSWKEFAANAKFRHMAPRGARDIGIDAVAEMKNGSLAAIQIKTGAKNLTKNDLSKFIAQGTVTPGGVPRYAYQLLIYTNPDMHEEAVDLLQLHHGGLVIDRPSFAAAEPADGWQALLDDTKAQRGDVTRPAQTEGPGDTRSEPGEIDGGTPPEPLTWAQTINRRRGSKATKYPELDDRAWLTGRYVTDGASLAVIADEVGCSPSAVSAALTRHGRPASGASRPGQLDDRAWLTGRYVTDGASLAAIADEVGCSPTTVSAALTRHDIPTRPANGASRPGQLDDPGWLTRRYVTDGASTRAIADEVGCDPTTVLAALTRHDIPTRTANASRPGQLDDPGWLTRRYVTDGESQADIADEVGCSRSAVSAALTRHGIPTRPAGPPSRHRQLDDRSWLTRRYVTDGASQADIADEVGCDPSTVSAALTRHGIPTRLAGRPRPGQLDDPGWLTRRYVTDGASTRAIADEVGCSPSAVSAALTRHGIPTRPAGWRSGRSQ